ncbi:MAG: FAD-dependent oxidoreductase, partial [Flammeovirgaceae bacterium]
KFESKVFPKDIVDITEYNDDIPVWWKASATADENYTGEILVGWVAADKARKLYALSDEEIVNLATEDLRKKLNNSNIKPTKTHIQIWKNEPFTLGAYSYTPAQANAEIVQVLAKPIDDKLFWAGEATDPKNYATVQGAYNSGKRVADEVYKG